MPLTGPVCCVSLALEAEVGRTVMLVQAPDQSAHLIVPKLNIAIVE